MTCLCGFLVFCSHLNKSRIYLDTRVPKAWTEAQQLQADYESLVANINDASEKISDLRARLWKMEGFAQKFIALPSGVWNKIDAN